jgi:hypothetical protein
MITWAIVYLLTHAHPEWVDGYFLGWAYVADCLIFSSIATGISNWGRK